MKNLRRRAGIIASSRSSAYATVRGVALCCAVVACGCSWILPHPSTSDAGTSGTGTSDGGMLGLGSSEQRIAGNDLQQCSLDVLQARKELPQNFPADGTPAPMIIRGQAPNPADRRLRNGATIFFVQTRHDADPPRDYGPDMNRHVISLDPQGPLPPTSVWALESVDPNGTILPADTTLVDGATLYLHRDGSGYLQAAAAGAETVPSAAHATRFVIYKIDVPDQTRPSTCDTQLRDGDFVYLRALAPSRWVQVNGTGVISAAASTTARGATNPQCAQQEQRCHTDQTGGLICAWAPACAN